MNKVGIVILNYLNYKDTIDCVKSLKMDLYENKEIVIVDNDSNNESYDTLKSLFSAEKNIHVIKNDTNLGFARGNNEGILYAREKLKCDHVLLLNSDTTITCDNFIYSFIKAYEKGIGLIGCRIVKLDGGEQNPFRLDINKQFIEECLYKHRNNKFTVKEKLLSTRLYDVLKTTIFKKIRIKKNMNKVKNNICSLDLVLHGSCIMLTEDYFEYYPYLYPETFLYCEEFILTILTRKVNLKKLFINDTFISHKEGQSSKMSFRNKNQVIIDYNTESYSKCYELFDMNYEEICKKYFRK